MALTDTEYVEKLNKFNNLAKEPRQVAEAWEEDNREWYHATINEEDFKVLVALENLEWYSCCRCHLIKCNDSIYNEHIHALVHFKGHPTLAEFKKHLGKELILHPGTIFKKIACLDHLVGVLHYLACDCSRPIFGNASPHKHYANIVCKKEWLHKRSNVCCKRVRDDISKAVSEGVENIDNYDSPLALHNVDSCLCVRGRDALDRRKMNRKRRLQESSKKGLGLGLKKTFQCIKCGHYADGVEIY